MISGYITHLDYDKLLKLLDDPDIICPSCTNKDDCIGKEECFNRENYKYIRIRIDRTVFWGQPRPWENERSNKGGAGGLDQLEQIEINSVVEESDQSKEGEVDLLGEVDHR